MLQHFFQETLNCSYDFFIQHLVREYHWFSPTSFLAAPGLCHDSQRCAVGQPCSRAEAAAQNWDSPRNSMRRLNHRKGMVFSSHQMDKWVIRGVSTSCFNQPGNAIFCRILSHWRLINRPECLNKDSNTRRWCFRCGNSWGNDGNG
jgi:hypothetical protein